VRIAGLLRLLPLLLPLALPGLAAAQAKDAPAATGCARFAEPAKRAVCEHQEAQKRKDATRKAIDAERKAERHCAKAADDKQRAECEKKAATAKPKS
jgi:hypothetical protein